MRGSILKLRGIMLGRTCPSCGSETMRTDGTGVIDAVLRVARLRRRWCRRCHRQWIAPRTLRVPAE